MNIDDNKDNNIGSSPHVGDLLPGYLDSNLPDADLAAVRAHLDTCDACRADYADLQATRTMLQHVPVILTPRSFVITEEMAGRVRKPSLFERIFTPRVAPTFAGGSVVAFVLLVFLFATSTTSVSVSAPQAMSGLFAQSTELSTPSDTSRVAQNSDAQPKQPGPETTSTTAAGGEPTALAMSAPSNNDTAQAPETPDPLAITSAQSLPKATPSADHIASTGAGVQPPAGGLANEPGMTTYSGNYTATPPVSGTSILELGLLALGIALAAAAIIARRRI
jgi:anti-sigma factor RsiW